MAETVDPITAAHAVALLENNTHILVGDVGGTNTRLKLYEVGVDLVGAEVRGGARAPGVHVKSVDYLNSEYANFVEIVQAFLAASPTTATPPESCCLAVAGPVEANRVHFTNRNWTIDGGQLSSALGIARVRLVNDFVAAGYGLLTLDRDKECVCLQEAPHVEGAPIACVGAGTGLGEVFSTAAEPGAPYESFASEGGHAEFAPRSDLEYELLTYLKRKFGQKHRVSVERVISGPGLASIYEFLAARFPKKVLKPVHAEFEAAGDMQGRVVASHSSKHEGSATSRYCALCDQAMGIFLGAYGAEVGVVALKFVPFGGLYVAGGLAPKNISRITEAGGPFMAAFLDKGRLSPLLRRVPLYVVMAEDIGVRGAHLVAFKLAQANWRAKGGRAADAQTKVELFQPISMALMAAGVAAAALLGCAKK